MSISTGKKTKTSEPPLTSAMIWCKKARDILKLKTTGKVRDSEKETSQYKRYKAVLKSIDANLKKLSKSGSLLHAGFVNKFTTLVGVDEKLRDEKLNFESITALSFELELLDNQIKVALDPNQKPNVDKSNMRLMIEERGYYIDALKEAERVLKELQGLKSAMNYGPDLGQHEHAFEGQVAQLIAQAKNYDVINDQVSTSDEPMVVEQKRGRLKAALESLGKVGKEADAERRRHTLFLELRVKFAPAHEMRQRLLLVDSGKTTEHAKAVTEVMTAVVNHAKVGKFAEAIAKLREVKPEYEKALKKVPKNDLVALKKYTTDRQELESRFADLVTRTGKAERLSGAGAGALKDLLKECRDILADARTSIDNATEPAGLVQAAEHLKKVEERLAKTQELSDKHVESTKSDLKNLKPWLKLERQVESDLRELRDMPAAATEYAELSSLLSQARDLLSKDPLLKSGYSAACKFLNDKNYSTLLEQGRKKQEAIGGVVLPQEIQSLEQTTSLAIARLIPNGSLSQVAIYQDALQSLVSEAKLLHAVTGQVADPDPKKVEQLKVKLEKLKSDAESELQTIEMDKESSQQLQSEVNRKLEELRKALVPEAAFGFVVTMLDQIEKQELTDREWKRAIERLQLVERKTGEIAAAHERFKNDWDVWSGLAKDIRSSIDKAKDWPPLAEESRSLLVDVKQVDDAFAKSGDYDRCLDMVAALRLDVRIEDFKAKLLKKPANTDFSELGKKVKHWTTVVNGLAAELERLLLKLESQLTGVAERSLNSARAEYTKSYDLWFDFSSKRFYQLSVDDPSPPTVEEIDRKAQEILKALSEQRDRINELLQGGQPFDLFLKQTTEAEQVRTPKVADRVAKLLEGLTEAGAEGVPALRERYLAQLARRLPDQEGDEKQREQTLEQLATECENALNQALIAKQQMLEKVAQQRKVVKKHSEDLDKLALDYPMFNEYCKELRKQLLDVTDMFDSNDATLIGVADQILLEAEKKLTLLDPAKKDKLSKDDVSFKQVQKRIEEVGALFDKGLVDDPLMKEMLPATYEEVKKKYADAILVAQRSSPTDGMKALDEVEVEIFAALDRANRKSDQVIAVKERITQAELLLAKVKQTTDTRVTEKAGRVEEFVATRLEEAEKALKGDDGIAESNVLLGKVEMMLNGILNAPDPRQQLFTEDGRMKQELEEVIAMAQQFQVEYDFFKEKTLKAAKSRVEEAAKDGVLSEADAKDSLKSLEGVGKSTSGIKKTLKPYLALLDTLKYDAVKAPDIKKARTDFERARGLLAGSKNSVERIVNSTTSVNVNITGDFAKVERNWTQQVRGFNAAIDEVTNAIEKLKLDAADPKHELFASLDQVTASADAADKLLKKLKAAFRQQAFSPAFKILGEDTKPKGPELEKQQSEKLAAREEVLGIMRQYRNRLQDNRVLRKLLDKKNPFARQEFVKAYAYIKSALKRVELETLIGE